MAIGASGDPCNVLFYPQGSVPPYTQNYPVSTLLGTQQQTVTFNLAQSYNHALLYGPASIQETWNLSVTFIRVNADGSPVTS